MAGGLFGRPFVINVKCILFSLVCMMLFLITPPDMNNKLMISTALIAIFAISYVAMAWYDYYYDCRIAPLKRAKYSITGLFKPPVHIPEKQLCIDSDKPKKIIIYIFHILLVVPILLYIVTMGKKANVMVYPLLGAMTVFTALYHGIKLIDASHS
jgi:hypothetical protein